jgi:phage tail-like protein
VYPPPSGPPAPSSPYGAFNFVVEIEGGAGGPLGGGFTDISGLGSEVDMADYRAGSGRPRPLPLPRGRRTVVLRRGLVTAGLQQWLVRGRKQGPGGAVTITLRGAAGEGVCRWVLQGVQPVKWTGPTLAPKGGGDVEIEELVLTAEGLDPV